MYGSADAKDPVFGAEFCTNRIKAFANITDEDNIIIIKASKPSFQK